MKTNLYFYSVAKKKVLESVETTGLLAVSAWTGETLQELKTRLKDKSIIIKEI
jgi:hypothetical protein